MNSIHRSLFVFYIILFTGLFSSSLWSISLEEAKSAGLIGEQANGYLGIISKPPSKEIKSLVKDVNSKRKIKYIDISNTKNIPLEAVEKQAGIAVYKRTKEGNYFNSGKGWKKK